MGSSVPRHGARVRTKTQEKEQKQPLKKKKKTRANCKLAQKNIEITIYMMREQINVMMHALMQ